MHLIFRLCLAHCLAFAAIGASKSDLSCRIEGEVLTTDYELDGTVLKQEKQMFTVWLQDQNWFIRTYSDPNLVSLYTIKYSEVGTDGTNVYKVSILNPEFDAAAVNRLELKRLDDLIEVTKAKHGDVSKFEKQKARLEKSPITNKGRLSKSKNQAIGAVRPFPFMQFDYADPSAVVWLAYCSGPYLNSDKSGKLPQVWKFQIPHQILFTNTVAAVATRSMDFPYLPTKIVYMNEGVEFKLSDGAPIQQRLLPPFELGYTNAVYEATGFTNLDGISVASVFTLVGFKPKPDADKSSRLCINTVCQGTLTSYHCPSGRIEFIPSSPVAVLIDDRRIGEQYMAQAGPMLRTTNRTELFAFHHDMLRKRSLRTKNVQHATLVFVIISSLFGLWLFFRAGRQGVEKTKNNAIS